MYNAKDADSINKFNEEYKSKHSKFIKQLEETKESFASAPYWPERQQELHKALRTHLQFPTNDMRKTQQLIAPIIPFTAEFTIDGINGFRYGDVLEFKMLPAKYQINTIFSIISITHNVSSGGEWTTTIRCIMRSAIK